MRARRALTLVELLVVLIILVLLAGLAIQSTEQVLQQGRFDATQRQLENIGRAVFDASDPGFGARSVSGYLADVGELPASLDDLINPNGSPSYNPTLTTSDPAITIAGGWRGPYLRAPPGSGDITEDFYGGVLQFSAPVVTSRGADGADGGGDDLSITLPSGGTVLVTVSRFDTGGTALPFQVDVRLYEPTRGGAVNENEQLARDPESVIPISNVSPGTRFVRAYEAGGGPRSSNIAAITVLPGSNTSVTLVFPAP